VGAILAAGAALVVSGGAALLARALPGWRTRIAAGGPVWLGLGVGLLVLWLTSAATNLVAILLVAALVSGLVETVLQVLEAHWVVRALAQLVVLGATMGLEYRRGDMFAVTAAVGAVVGVAVVQGLAFATRAAQLSGSGRTPPVVALLGTAYLFVVAQGLPNPGLATLVLVMAAAVLPVAILPVGGGVLERALGPVLAGLAWASGICAWLANASPAMVLAPVVVVGLDVGWTLTRRLVTAEGRARLASAGGWWRGLGAWGEPADDLVVQRAAAAGSGRAASGWLIGATAAVLVLSLVQWLLEVRWLPALLEIVLLALGWLLLQLARVRLPRADLLAWLVAFTAAAGVLAVAEYLTDGRRLVAVLPLLVPLTVWAAAMPRLLGRPARNDPAAPRGGRAAST
jgi:hypothetical protein